jgi:hypothetical protein
MSQPSNLLKLNAKDTARFWSRVDKINGPLPDQTNKHYKGLDRCWLWLGNKDTTGYGQLWANRHQLQAHRIAWVLEYGLIPDTHSPNKTCILHKCDQRDCCNPLHLQLGTLLDNVCDMVAKNRQAKGDANGSRIHPKSRPRGARHHAIRCPECLARGERNGLAKLTPAAVKRIRRRYAEGGITQQMLAERVGVTASVISKVVRRALWAHI